MPEPEQDQRAPRSRDWWRDAVVYQVYPRSFADANADGIGDLPGIRSRLHYLSELGVDALWLSPFYPSPLADGGYDITDHRGVDPRLGTLDDFDALVHDAHGLGLKLIIDLVPNHTSDQHPWFREAVRAGPGSPARDRYIFRDGAGPDGSEPPSDWRSHFGGPAWERLDDGQWYCHLFAREQPDLNWDNAEVRQYFLDTLRFWADRGVDGFRIDVAHSLAKDLSAPLRSQPNLDRILPLDGSDPLYDRDEVHEIYRSWRGVFDEYDPPKMAVAETWHPTTSRTYLYARPDELGQVFDFSLLKSEWHPDQFRAVITRSIDEHRCVGGAITWVLSSHDVPRHASRYALPLGTDLDAWLRGDGTQPAVDEATASRRARAATVMMLALPGSAYLYQGEELGLLEVADLPEECLQDPVFERTGRRLKGRDGCRVPLPWESGGRSYGFGEDGAWLPQPAWFAAYAVSAQQGRDGSSIELYRRALALRRAAVPDAGDSFAWRPSGHPEVLRFARSAGWECMVNFSAHAVPIPGDLILSSDPEARQELAPDAAAWFVPSAERV
ncbi:MAG TPA: glycoside hydrolase family 13 protein [Intrasporangium sp.]|uniref:glycoside hydrolase family 13 protein n=1 Tax=Intrasporangium sp. TaxID=1925024 RepID=UPI002D7899BF|nr:glycoside hydrolase family 13 protein [Intrasporangium sp.]HET7397319.1 glycoside hydrolase family 13 protein [Intrasporangium sp.]